MVGGYPIPGLAGGYPIPGLAGGIPHPRSGQGGTPSQVWPGEYPISGPRGVTQVLPPSQTWDGVPHQTWDGVPPWTWDWVPPQDLGQGALPFGPGMGYPPRQISIGSTCYTAGGMPLAFTQEDFLVL